MRSPANHVQPAGVASGVTPGRARLAAVSAVVALLGMAALASGCVYSGGGRSGDGWQMKPGSVSGDWRQLDMQALMAYSDTWFVVDEQRRGSVEGFASGGMEVSAGGGYFELSVISRQSGVPVQQTVRVYFDAFTEVYVGGSSQGTVLDGLTTADGYNIAGGGRMLEVPFYVNGGRLSAERVTVLDDPAPQVR